MDLMSTKSQKSTGKVKMSLGSKYLRIKLIIMERILVIDRYVETLES